MSYTILLVELFNLVAINCGPLSETINSGMPNLAKTHLNSSIVVKAVAVFMGITSFHLECASMMTKNILPSRGPPKSMCSWHCYDWRGAAGGVG